jgi:beta-lactamase regulating signal transducer with metallopeptidase domain/protocatechuate 3,4-dioxygenase beta subunit
MALTTLLHRIVEQLAAVGPPALPATSDAAIKGVFILALVALATLAMHRASAAARHLVWFVGTLSLLVLPILSLTLPGWHVLPAWATSNLSGVEPQAVAPFAPSVADSTPPPAGVPVHADDASARANAAAPSPLESAAPAPLPVPQSARIRLPWQSWVVLAWLVGSAVLLGQIALGALSLMWLRRRSSRIADGRWPALVREIIGELGIRRPVELLSSSRRAMPMVWGLWHIRVLLPEESADWMPEQCRVVVLHELAHARRFDCLTQLVSQLACAVCWFNPLVWLARWRMQIERERACDDLVLASGTKASAYAEQLLRIAAQMPVAPYGAAAIAMARPSTLEGRVVAILDTTRNRRRIAATGAILVTVAIGLSAVALAALRAEENRDPPAGFGRVVDVQGRPIAGAKLTDQAAKWSAVSGPNGLFPLPKTQRPGQFGQFNILVEAAGFVRRDSVSLLLDPTGKPEEQTTIVDVSKRPTEGRGIIGLQRPGRVEGSVLGLDGKPLAAAPVQLDVRNYFDGMTTCVGNAASTVTDANGRFILDKVTPGELLLRLRGSNARSRLKEVGTGLRVTLADGQTLKDVVLDLSKSTAVATGRVVDKTGKAISGAHVAFVWENGGGWTWDPWPDGIKMTDDQGRYRLTGLPPGKWHILANFGTTYSEPVPVVLSEKSASVADVVLPVIHAPAGRLRRVQPTAAAPPPAGFGRVVDMQGAPIAAAKLKSQTTKWSAVSGADGLFPLPELRPITPENLDVTADGFMYRDDVNLWRNGDGEIRPDHGVIQLLRPGRLEGYMRGPDGKPLASAPISVNATNRFAMVVNAAHAVSDAKGRFVIENVPPGELLLYYPGEPYRDTPVPIRGIGTALAIELADGQTARDLALDLSQSTEVAAGRVVDKDGKPVAGAEVYLSWKSNEVSPAGIVAAKTDQQGRYRLEKLPKGTWQVRAVVGTASAESAPVALSKTAAPLPDLVLPVVHTASGRIRRVQPMNAEQTIREWIDATLAGDAEGVQAVVAPQSAFARNSGRIGPLLSQINRFTMSSWSDEAGRATTNELELGGGRRGTITFKMLRKSGDLRISDVLNEAGASLVAN